MKFTSFILAAVLLLTASNYSQAVITFQFNYTDPLGQGFNVADPVGQERRDALTLAGQNFATAFSAYSATIQIDVDGTAAGSTLAAAGSETGSNTTPGFGLNEVIRNKILNSTDLNGSTKDGTVNVNWGINWQLDINATPTPGPSGEFDWYSTMYHEFAHALGFSSGIFTDSSGQNPTDSFNQTVNGSWAKFDEFLRDVGGNSFFNSPDLNVSAYTAALVGGASPGAGLFFTGPNAGTTGIYSPTTFSEGSSGSHLDDENTMLAGLMMLSATDTGPSARIFSALEQNMFKDIGYTQVGQIVAIPEPSAILLMGLVACMVCGRKSMPRITSLLKR